MNDEKYLYNHWRLSNKGEGGELKRVAADVFRARPDGQGKGKGKGKVPGPKVAVKGKAEGVEAEEGEAATRPRVRGPRDPAWAAPPQQQQRMPGRPGAVGTGREAPGAGSSEESRRGPAASQILSRPTPSDAAAALRVINEEEDVDEELLATPPARQVEAYIRGYNRTMNGSPLGKQGGAGGEVSAAAMQQQEHLRQRQAQQRQQKEMQRQLEMQREQIRVQQEQLERHQQREEQLRNQQHAAQQQQAAAQSPVYYPKPVPQPAPAPAEEDYSRAALNGSIGQLQAQVAGLQRELRAERGGGGEENWERLAHGREVSHAVPHSSRDRASDLAELLRQSEEERARLESSRDSARREAEGLRLHVAGLMREAAGSRQRLEDVSRSSLRETTALQREVARLESELSSTSRNQGEWQSMAAGMKEEFAHGAQRQVAMEAEIQRLQNALQYAQDEVARERGRASELERELGDWEAGRKATSPAPDERALRRRLDDAEIRAATLSKQLADAQRRFGAERAEWQAAMAERNVPSPAGSDVSVELLEDAGETLRNAREEVEAERARGAQRLSEAQREGERIKRQLERALRESVDQVADLQVELGNAEKRAKEAEAELKRQPKTPAKVPGFVMSPAVKVGILESSLSDARREANEAKEDAAKAREEAAEAREMHGATEAKCTTLERKLEKAKEQVIHLEEQSRLLLLRTEGKAGAASRTKVMELEEEVANLRDQLRNAQRDREIPHESAPSLMGSPADTPGVARELRRELAEERQLRTDAAELAEQMKAELKAALEAHKNDGEIEELKANLEKYRLLSEALRVDNRAYKEAARSLESDVQTLQADKRALAQDKKALQEDKKGLTEEVRLARAATDRERATLEGLRERLADVEAQLVALRAAQEVQFEANGALKPRAQANRQVAKSQAMTTPALARGGKPSGNTAQRQSSISPDLEAAVSRLAPVLGLRVSTDSMESVPRLNLAVSPVPTSNSEGSDDMPVSPCLSGRKPLGDVNLQDNDASSREHVKPYSSNVQRSLEETSASIGSKKSSASRATRKVTRQEMESIIELREGIEADIARLKDRRGLLLSKGAGKKGADSHVAMELATAEELLRRREAQLESVGVLQRSAEAGTAPSSAGSASSAVRKSPRQSIGKVPNKVAAFR